MTPQEKFAERQRRAMAPRKPSTRKNKNTKTEIRLPESFVAPYAKLQPDWGPLGWVVYKRTYSRWIDESMKRREEWHETVRRVVEGNINLDPRPRTPEVAKELLAEAKEMYDAIFNLVWTPPGRSLWIGGTDYSKKVGDSLVNCWFVAIRPGKYNNDEEPKASFPFVMAMDLLAKGGGVGFSVTRDNIMQFPMIATPVRLHIVCDDHHPNWGELDAGLYPQNTHTLIRVADSRRGWTDALRVLIDGHFKNHRERHIVFDVSDVRPSGSAIKGFGGVAAGPGPLVRMLRSVNGILNDRVGGYLSPVEATDMMNFIGRCIVAGGVRRSSEVALGSPDDLAFIGMKLDEEKKMSHRWASNNSIVIDNEFEDFERIASSLAVNGEPGIFNLELARTRGRLVDEGSDPRNAAIEGINPCITGDTWIMTAEGPKLVTELLGTPHETLINGSLHPSTEAGFWSNGLKPVLSLQTTEGYQLKLTANHQVLRQGIVGEEWVPASELKTDDKIILHNHRSFKGWPGKGSFAEGWLLGELIGDGTSDERTVMLDFWGDNQKEMAAVALDYIHGEIGARSNCRGHSNAIKTRLSSTGLAHLSHEYEMFITGKKATSDAIEKTSSQFHRGFLRGLFDADGSVQGNLSKGISVRLSQSNLDTLYRVQRMLLRLGISSNIYEERRPAGSRLLPDGHGGAKLYDCNADHELIISRDCIPVFAKRVGFHDHHKQGKLNRLLAAYKRTPYKSSFTARVKSITELGVEEVFDCSIPGQNAFDANGLYVHNCGEIPLSSRASNGVDGSEPCNLAECYPAIAERKGYDMERVVRMALRYTKRITCARYEWPGTRRIVKDNRRVGVSLSGIHDWMVLRGTTELETLSAELDQWYKYVRDEDEKYSKVLHVPTSVAVTTVKPSGTVSLLSGSSPGMHAHQSRWYIRRIRFQKNDPLVDLLAQCGFTVENDAYSPNTMVVEFPIEAPGAHAEAFRGVGDLMLEEQFATQATLQRWWSDNSVSATLTFKPKERRKLEGLLREYSNKLKCTTLLPYTEPGEKTSFVQMPYEPITEEKFKEINAKIKSWPHELARKLHEQAEREYEIIEESDCTSGACPVR